MKLCVVTHKVVKGDGQGRVNYEVVQEALRRGYHVTLLASSIAPDLAHHDFIRWIPISTEGLPTQLLQNAVFSWKCAQWLKLYRHEFDVLQVNGAITSFPSDVNAVHFVHSAWLKSPAHPAHQFRNHYGLYQWLYTRLNAEWEKQAFQQSKVMIAVSDKVKRELIEIGVPEDKIRVILNGVDLQEFCPGEGDRISLNLPERVPLALFIGDIKSNRKNLDTVLQALVKVSKLHLAVVGNTEGSPYPQLVAQLELSTRVHFLGFRHDVAVIMKSADFFVFPSRYEPFGMVISEAMATGLPIITSVNVGAADLVNADSGIVISDLNDVAAIAQAMKTLSNNLGLQHWMGQAARAVAQQHSWESKAKAYLAVFEGIAQI